MKFAVRLASFLIAASTLNAQGWNVGLKGGLGQGGFTKHTEFAWSSSGMNLALSFSRAITPRLSIQPELATSQTIGHSMVGGSALTYSSDDVALPMLVRADLSQRAGVTPFVLAGPSLTIHAGCNLQFVVSGSVSRIDCEQASFLSKLDFGVVAGGGIGKTFGPSTVSAELRANVNLRTQPVPDGSGYARGLGWAFLIGATVPLDTPPFHGRTPKAVPGISVDDKESPTTNRDSVYRVTNLPPRKT